MKDRGFVRALVERAVAAKCSALVVTLDLSVVGQRNRDIKNRMGMREDCTETLTRFPGHKDCRSKRHGSNAGIS
jgi:isopentenyl diphosphate isomerase/L-lactate dehydrogenase-like FMN-dependent dehydrogenase